MWWRVRKGMQMGRGKGAFKVLEMFHSKLRWWVSIYYTIL